MRSKVAGPFWMTIDLFFDGEENYRKYHDNAAHPAACAGEDLRR
jgi:hypothetical protein